jgi:hypothetical protein
MTSFPREKVDKNFVRSKPNSNLTIIIKYDRTIVRREAYQ